MESNKSQQEIVLPTDKVFKRKSSDLLPRIYRTDSNSKFLQSTVDQLTQPGAIKKINGYIGRESAKSVKSSDVFLTAANKDRQDYQLEPAAVIQDYYGNVTFFKDYIDHINHIKTFGGNVDNHARINKQEFYSWNPHVCWDKLVNFQEYYWLESGPTAIEVAGSQKKVVSTLSVSLVKESDNSAYLFTPNGLTLNPSVTLYRGQTYRFEINSPHNPFSIKTSRSYGEVDRYLNGIDEVAVENGVITFTVPKNAPAVLYYCGEVDANAGGEFVVKDITENTFLDVDADIVGKKHYKTSTGVELSNGMCVTFTGNVSPEKYSTSKWVVEGVGDSIVLVNFADLEIYSQYGSPAIEKDYIVINRSSLERSAWARYNRWFHIDVIKQSADIAGIELNLDQSLRAARPIIEFEAGLQLFNYGYKNKESVDLIDRFTTDAFSTVNGSHGYNVDGVELAEGMRVIFAADTDPIVRGKTYTVKFIDIDLPGRMLEFNAFSGIKDNTIIFETQHSLVDLDPVVYLNNSHANLDGISNRSVYYVKVIDGYSIQLFADKTSTTPIHLSAITTAIETHKLEVYAGSKTLLYLEEAIDVVPNEFDTVLIKQGLSDAGKLYWFDGYDWNKAQDKTIVNQPPLFDVFDENGVSFSKYEASTFKGTKLFSYKVGSGSADTVLGFPLSYLNINNIGDITFSFDLLTDTFSYKAGLVAKEQATSVGYLSKVNYVGVSEFVNGWVKSKVLAVQPVVRVFKESGLANNFPIDVFDHVQELDDLRVDVFINGKQLPRTSYSIGQSVAYKIVVLSKDALLSDVITLECYTKQKKNDKGYYKIPLNLQHNPLNSDLKSFTLGQVTDHVASIVSNYEQFDGLHPGSNNLRDAPQSISSLGTKIVQHSSPLNLSLYHLGSRLANVIKALEKSREDYGQFKRTFLRYAESSGIDADPRAHVDFILTQMLADKPKTSPYYLSDMFAHTGSTRLEIEVVDSRIKIYPLTMNFSLAELSNKSVLIYLNGTQLLAGIDYMFADSQDFFEVLCEINDGDMFEVYEYVTTDGSFCPATPTKLGLYPKYEPKIFVDESYLEPTKVIQGHDGSIIIAYNDYRDELILELEKRIFNNIKVEYNPEIFDIFDYIPGYNRLTDYSREEFDAILAPMFFAWTANINQDYTKYVEYDRLNQYTFNYRDNYAPDGSPIPAYWRGIFKWMLDTETPHVTPWECLGFSIKPKWWEEVYGPAPYTSNNSILWDDITAGIIREPGKLVTINTKMAKPILKVGLPVDELGVRLNPIFANYAAGFVKSSAEGFWIFGDTAPVEAAWRNSSYFPFALMQAIVLMSPSDILGKCLDRSRIVKNKCGQLVYAGTNTRIKMADLVLPSVVTSESRVYTSGLVNYIVDYIVGDINSSVSQYKNDLESITNKVASKLGGFTSKQKFNLLLDSKNPSATNGVFVPTENYSVFLNTSSPIKTVAYSGVIITLFDDGFEIKGYNLSNPYFNYYSWDKTGSVIKVGGISESFLEWSAGEKYVEGKIVFFNGKYYRTKVTHISDSFNSDLFVQLPELPVIGGVEANLRTGWNKEDVQTLAYSTKLTSVQEVVDFLLGYGEYLADQGFVFDNFDSTLNSVANWLMSAKEFMFWTTQNWAPGAVISLSPSAQQLTLSTGNAVVQNIFDPFYTYQIFRVDGNKLNEDFTNVFRDDSSFNLSTSNTGHGVYGATLYLVQKEHVLLLDNVTMFNDVIYDLETGYKQDRLKAIGYVSKDWTGGFNIPGFIFDDAVIVDWQQWHDYALGDTVKFKEFYYSANQFIPGADEFDPSQWTLLAEKPVAKLIPNWDYRANQFMDFYDLDTDNFDVEQQRLAQHLIGYQPRAYLREIISDDVSQYKFYQGMIAEKGTKNSLSKLFDVISAADKESIELNEEWAVRVGTFGAIDAFKEVDLPLVEGSFKLNPQPIEISDVVDSSSIDLIYRIPFSKIYNQSRVSPIFPVSEQLPFLRTPGYLRYDEAALHVNTLSDLNGLPSSALKKDDLVWCGFEGRSWNVYVCQKASIVPESATASSGQASVTIPNGVPTEVKTTCGSTITLPRGVSRFTITVPFDAGQMLVFDDDQTIFDEHETTFDGFVRGNDFAFEPKEPKVVCGIDSYDVEATSSNEAVITISNFSKWQRNVRIDVFNNFLNKYDTESEMIVTYNAPVAITGDVIGISSTGKLDGFAEVLGFSDNRLVISADSTLTGEIDVAGSEVYTFTSRKPRFTQLWQQRKVLKPAATIIERAFIYNKKTNKLITSVDVIDVTQGQIHPLANKELTFKTYYDPAIYSTSANDVEVIAEEGQHWEEEQVGMLWWDLTRARFLENQQGSAADRAVRWNQLYSTASIDIYEWVSSKYKPAEWDTLADTEKGLTLGISGTSKYGNDAYSVRQRFDTVSRTMINTYYFWVKNKKTVPQVIGRSISAGEVSNIIADPIAAGYPCMGLLGENSFTIANVSHLLEGDDVSITLKYKVADTISSNVHSQWKIISESASTLLPAKIETKWFDSLVGVDKVGQTVPNMSIPAKIRYGIENTPSQSMFVNRVEALKQYVERVNSVIKSQLITERVDLSMISKAAPTPTVLSGEWDVIVDTDADLKYIKTPYLVKASLTPIIVDGRVVRVDIANPGFGYKNPPVVKLVGQGSDAEIKIVLGDSGRIIVAEVIKPGKNYLSTTLAIVRPFTALVLSDAFAYDKWTVRAWNASTQSWDIVKIQPYDVSKFWEYVDWYADGFNQFIKINHVVQSTYDLAVLEANIGDIIKVKTIGAAGWALMQKFDDKATVDYTENYKVIAREKGTIQFTQDLYLTDKVADGYDELFYDLFMYDNFPVEEIRIILNFVKSVLFAGDLYKEYLKLFFSSIRYLLSEQLYTDWIFKTSFIKAEHYLGKLKQPTTFNADPLDSFDEYVKEVKPYRTKIREHVSRYDTVDGTQTITTDFDLPPFISADKTISPVDVSIDSEGNIVTQSEGITSIPWKYWYDNVGFKIEEIQICNGGSGYISEPAVVITGGFGTGATAKAIVEDGVVVRIDVLNSGSGYLKAPKVVLSGGVSEDGVPATAVAVIKNDLIRSNKISIKFDRIAKSFQISELSVTETGQFGDGVRTQFPLRFSPKTTFNSSTIVVGSDVLPNSSYSLKKKTAVVNGRTYYSGIIVFNRPPAEGLPLSFTYDKDFEHLSATDRINFYYNPTAGQFGKGTVDLPDYSQLMSGVDYGGNVISGRDFAQTDGWGSSSWSVDSWDEFNGAYSYAFLISDPQFRTFELPMAPNAGDKLNVYIGSDEDDYRTRVDYDPEFEVYESGKMEVFVGTGQDSVIHVPDEVQLTVGSYIIFRKEATDNNFDTQLSGGEFNVSYSSATGASPDDINIDGDGFVSAETSYAPEEVVPGQIVDALALKVFTRPMATAPRILVNDYKVTAGKVAFDIGQRFPSSHSVVVKVDKAIVDEGLYTIDWAANLVVLDAAFAQTVIDKTLTVTSFSFNSTTMLDQDFFVADGKTKEFVTKAPWSRSLSSIVLVNGKSVVYELFKTDESYHFADLAGIRFAKAPAKDEIVDFMIDTGEVLPSIVISSVANKVCYTIDPHNLVIGDQVVPQSSEYGLNFGTTYFVKTVESENSFTLSATPTGRVVKLVDGNIEVVAKIIKTAEVIEYSNVETGVLELPRKIVAAEYVWVIKNGLVLDLTTDYYINEDKMSITVLESSITDLFTVILFDKVTVHKSFGYMQFKDMLNRVHYKRISKDKTTELASDAFQADNAIYVVDGTKITPPDVRRSIPGIVEIDGERIEFMGMEFVDQSKSNMAKLFMLRRGTLGTGVPARHRAGLFVVDLGYTETIPYTDTEITSSTKLSYGKCQVKNGKLTVTVEYAGKLEFGNSLEIIIDPATIPVTTRTVNIVKVGDIENTFQTYMIDDTSLLIEEDAEFYGNPLTIIPINSMLLESDVNDTSLTVDDLIEKRYMDAFNVFVGGYRLKKTPFEVFGKYKKDANGNVVLDKVTGNPVILSPDYPDSPSGDITLPADYQITVDADSHKFIELRVPAMQEVTLVKRQGRVWTDPGKPLGDSNSLAAKFIKNSETNWPQYLVDKYQYVLETDGQIGSSIEIDGSDGNLPDQLELD